MKDPKNTLCVDLPLVFSSFFKEPLKKFKVRLWTQSIPNSQEVINLGEAGLIIKYWKWITVKLFFKNIEYIVWFFFGGGGDGFQ